MRMHILAGFAAALFFSAAASQDETARDDLNRLQGHWLLVYQEQGGKKLPDEAAARRFDGEMVFTGDKIRYTVKLPGFNFEFAYKLDPSKSPKHMDLTLTTVPDKKGVGTKLKGIYQLEGDTLKLCYGVGRRPTELSGKAKAVLVVLRRAKGGG